MFRAIRWLYGKFLVAFLGVYSCSKIRMNPIYRYNYLYVCTCVVTVSRNFCVFVRVRVVF